jgi:hypothetical protein
MPVVLRVGGFAFKIFSNDHDPPHVHVRYAGKQCKMILSTLVMTHSDMNESEAATAVRIVVANREVLEAAWAAFHREKGGGE